MLVAAGVVVAAAVLTKYSAICLLPLLAAHAVLVPPRVRRTWALQAAALAIPVVTLVVFEWATAARYGHGLLAGAAAASSGRAADVTLAASVGIAFEKTVDVLAFAGGGCLGAALVGMLGRRPAARVGAGGAVAAMLAVGFAVGFHALHQRLPTGWDPSFRPGTVAAIGSHPSPGWYFLQMGVLAAAGVALGGVAVADVVRASSRRDRGRAAFLLLWMAGTAVFTGRFNWTINVRSVLPLAPAACVVAARHLGRLPRRPGGRSWAWPTCTAGAAAALVAVALAVSDDRVARANRSAVGVLLAGHDPGRVWYAGHWGFHYYMRQAGARAVDEGGTAFAAGDELVQPLDIPGTLPAARDGRRAVAVVPVGAGGWLTAMSRRMAAGFYLSPGDQLPFVVGPCPPESFVVYRVDPPQRPAGSPNRP